MVFIGCRLRVTTALSCQAPLGVIITVDSNHLQHKRVRMISFENVSKNYENKIVLDDISFRIHPGQFAVLIGPSGCGKTTTLKMINKLCRPDSGKVFVDGKDISQVDPVHLRRSIGYVVQQIGLFPNMTVEQNISVVPKLLKYDRQKTHTIVHDLLEMVGMPYDEFAHKYPFEMSGGQQQRIGVLRALAATPPIVLMDEPFGALDPVTRTSLQEEIRDLQKKLNKTFVFVTHDMDEALNLADVIIFMNEGHIVQMASPEEMLANPANDLIRSFMGKRALTDLSLPQKACNVMRTDIYTAYVSQSLRDAVEKMARRHVDSLIIKNMDDTYAGIVTIKDINAIDKHSDIKTVAQILRRENATSYTDEDAQKCFDKLMKCSDDYVVILHQDNHIAGIVTKTSMAKALADAVWRDYS